jgi:hypothetical protein
MGFTVVGLITVAWLIATATGWVRRNGLIRPPETRGTN